VGGEKDKIPKEGGALFAQSVRCELGGWSGTPKKLNLILLGAGIGYAAESFLGGKN